MIFMLHAILNTCGCCLSLQLLVGKEHSGSEYLDHIIIQEKSKYVLILFEDIDVFSVSIWCIVIDYVFLYFEVWTVSHVFSCLMFDEI